MRQVKDSNVTLEHTPWDVTREGPPCQSKDGITLNGSLANKSLNKQPLHILLITRPNMRKVWRFTIHTCVLLFQAAEDVQCIHFNSPF